MKAQMQKGFTLIELMIVVAIIGILAAIAIPQYQNYVSRTQVTRLVGEMSSLKTAVEERMSRNAATNTIADLGYTASNLSSNAAVAMDASAGTASITATLNGNVASAVNGGVVTVSRGADGIWSCEVTASSNTGWDDSFAPAGCPVGS
ncbi:type IV pilus assembly protein PilA [Pseudomonas linyingensis]|uniref:Pilin n=1 Tax=Pseudomonas linyingensis TaxID=915471 RepID=A0A1H6S3R4_9PSED|nr:pilin [Pseudomonas linyingensis]SEI62683.1 type IV pilus assembly protein PilA [Pseudomonas linyingensis]